MKSGSVSQADLTAMASVARDVRDRLKQMGFREKSTARMIAKLHGFYLCGLTTGTDILAFLTFLFLGSGLPLRSMAELYTSKGKAKKVKNIQDEPLVVIRRPTDFIHPRLMDTLGLASANSISSACAGLEMLIARSSGETVLKPETSGWMKASCEDTTSTREVKHVSKPGPEGCVCHHTKHHGFGSRPKFQHSRVVAFNLILPP